MYIFILGSQCVDYFEDNKCDLQLICLYFAYSEIPYMWYFASPYNIYFFLFCILYSCYFIHWFCFATMNEHVLNFLFIHRPLSLPVHLTLQISLSWLSACQTWRSPCTSVNNTMLQLDISRLGPHPAAICTSRTAEGSAPTYKPGNIYKFYSFYCSLCSQLCPVKS